MSELIYNRLLFAVCLGSPSELLNLIAPRGLNITDVTEILIPLPLHLQRVLMSLCSYSCHLEALLIPSQAQKRFTSSLHSITSSYLYRSGVAVSSNTSATSTHSIRLYIIFFSLSLEIAVTLLTPRGSWKFGW